MTDIREVIEQPEVIETMGILQNAWQWTRNCPVEHTVFFVAIALLLYWRKR